MEIGLNQKFHFSSHLWAILILGVFKRHSPHSDFYNWQNSNNRDDCHKTPYTYTLFEQTQLTVVVFDATTEDKIQ